MKTRVDHAKTAAAEHANLNAWVAVVSLLEGGTLSGAHTHSAQQRVIKIAQAEIHKHLRAHEAALAAVARS